MSQASSAVELSRWYQSPLGRVSAQAIATKLQSYLPDWFGSHLMQLGLPTQACWLASSPIRHHVLISEQAQPTSHAQVVARTQLPILPESIDVAILAHSLESTEDPHRLLTQVYQSLHAQGHLVVIGFNPWSGFGLWRWLSQRDQAPWNRQWQRAGRVSHWLRQAGFHILQIDYVCHYPPINSEKSLNRLLFLETLGNEVVLPYPGSIYLISAQKVVSAPTFIQPGWQRKSTRWRQRLIQPSANRITRTRSIPSSFREE